MGSSSVAIGRTEPGTEEAGYGKAGPAGPPNLIAHLLAHGKRVLVTSHTARALKVLEEKLPPEIRPLCVSLLGDDREALADLEESVRGITDRQSNWNAGENRDRLTILRSELDEARREAARVRRQLLDLRDAETVSHMVAGYSGTASATAQEVASDARRFDWFQDEPVDEQPPIDETDVDAILRSLDAVGLEQYPFRLIRAETIVSPEAVGNRRFSG